MGPRHWTQPDPTASFADLSPATVFLQPRAPRARWCAFVDVAKRPGGRERAHASPLSQAHAVI